MNIECRYNVGDTVYISHHTADTISVFCPTCKGLGKVTVDTLQYGELEITCPDCLDKLTTDESRYRKAYKFKYYAPKLVTILEISIIIDDITTEIYYTTKEFGDDFVFEENQIFQGIESCQRYCNQLNEKAYEKAVSYVYKKEE